MQVNRHHFGCRYSALIVHPRPTLTPLKYQQCVVWTLASCNLNSLIRLLLEVRLKMEKEKHINIYLKSILVCYELNQHYAAPPVSARLRANHNLHLKTKTDKKEEQKLINAHFNRILKNYMNVSLYPYISVFVWSEHDSSISRALCPLPFIHPQNCPPPFLYHLPQSASTLLHFIGDHLQFWSGLLLSSPMMYQQPDDTNAAKIYINMLPLEIHKPLFCQAHASSQNPHMFFYPEFNKAILAVTHIKQGSMWLLILGCNSPPPCSLCGSVALFPLAHCSNQRARLPVDLPRAPSWFTVPSLYKCICESTLCEIGQHLTPLFQLMLC